MIGSVASSNFNFHLSYSTDSNGILDDSIMYLDLDGILRLTCQRILIDQTFDIEYNFLNIFNQDFMSDIQIRASNGQIVNTIIYHFLNPNFALFKFKSTLNEF
jgi:hypothetical protein